MSEWVSEMQNQTNKQKKKFKNPKGVYSIEREKIVMMRCYWIIETKVESMDHLFILFLFVYFYSMFFYSSLCNGFVWFKLQCTWWWEWWEWMLLFGLLQFCFYIITEWLYVWRERERLGNASLKTKRKKKKLILNEKKGKFEKFKSIFLDIIVVVVVE